MKILIWNARGLNAPNKRRLVKRQLEIQNVDLILLQEIKLGEKESKSFIKACENWNGDFVAVMDLVGGIGLLWNSRILEVEVTVKNQNWMKAKIKILDSAKSFKIINAYGPTKNRREKSYLR